MLSDDAREKIRLGALRYPSSRSALLPALQLAQAELGHLSDDVLRSIAELLDLPESHVYGTASFYSLIRLRPSARHIISICHNLPCTLLGAEPLISHLRNKLGIEVGEVTPDGRFSYQRIECIGRCDGAPAMLVDDDYHGDLTPEKIDAILEKYI
jgi:NADH-quinone oxidoreductase subunit E